MTPTNGAEPESARVVRRLRDEILDGVRATGSKLVERDIADELAVSRVPVRDALKALEAEGLVTLRPRTWAVVREFTPSDVARWATRSVGRREPHCTSRQKGCPAGSAST